MKIAIVILLIVSLYGTSGEEFGRRYGGSTRCPLIKCARGYKSAPDPNNPPCLHCVPDNDVPSGGVPCMSVGCFCPVFFVIQDPNGCQKCNPPPRPTPCMSVTCGPCERTLYDYYGCPFCVPDPRGCPSTGTPTVSCPIVSCPYGFVYGTDPVTGCPICIPGWYTSTTGRPCSLVTCRPCERLEAQPGECPRCVEIKDCYVTRTRSPTTK